MTVLIVDTDRRTTECLTRLFRDERKFTVENISSATNESVEQHAHEVDLIIFELAPPFEAAVARIRELCEADRNARFLALVGACDRSLVAEILEAGADDCLTLPFSSAELIARVDALLRPRKHAPSVVCFANIVVNKTEETVRIAGGLLRISPIEYRILECLVEHEGSPVNKPELVVAAFDFNSEKVACELNSYVLQLNTKLRCAGGPRIETRDDGYWLVA